MDKEKESEIISLVRNGQTSRYRELVDAYGDRIFALVYKMIGIRADAEEIAQDVFVKAFFSLNTFHGKSSFSTWLFRIAYNMTISALRKKKKMVYCDDMEKIVGVIDDSQEDIFEKAMLEAKEELLEKAIARLLPQEKFLITAFYQENKSLADITEITGLSLSNVKVKLFRTKQKLGLFLNKE